MVPSEEENLRIRILSRELGDDILGLPRTHPASYRQTGRRGPQARPIPSIHIRHPDGRHRAERLGVGREHAVGERKVAGKPNIHKKEEGRLRLHQFAVGLSRLDMAAEMHDRLSAQAREIARRGLSR